ncbi:MAG: 50S ribosomal protein L23 [Dehalococcoidia bacterium]|nr:50S ribosomal protein L23 [Dehalococcoidia bacterium]
MSKRNANVLDVIERPLVTEKSTALAEKNKYAFEVATDANKHQIKEAVEKAFKVKVSSVNVLNVPGKLRRVGKHHGMTPQWKKAIVTVAPGFKIELFEKV